jgi:hypothetical protein
VKKNIFRSLTRIREEYLLPSRQSQATGNKSQTTGIRPQAETIAGIGEKKTRRRKRGE